MYCEGCGDVWCWQCGRRTNNSTHYGMLTFWGCPGMHFTSEKIDFISAFFARLLSLVNGVVAVLCVGPLCAALAPATMSFVAAAAYMKSAAVENNTSGDVGAFAELVIQYMVRDTVNICYSVAMCCGENEDSWAPEALIRLADSYSRIAMITIAPLLFCHVPEESGFVAVVAAMRCLQWLFFLVWYPISVVTHPIFVYFACLESIAVHAVALCEIEHGHHAAFNVFYPAFLTLLFTLRVACGTIFLVLIGLFIFPLQVLGFIVSSPLRR